MIGKNLDFGIPITFYNTNTFHSEVSTSGLFIGIQNGKVNSLILSSDLQNETENAPTFDTYAFTNVGILSQTFNSFNKILIRFLPEYTKNTYSDLINENEFIIKNLDDVFFDGLSQKIRLTLKFEDPMCTMMIQLPGYSIPDSLGISDFTLPDYSSFPVDKGTIKTKDETWLNFLEWFNHHIDEDEIRDGIRFHINSFHSLAKIRIAKAKKELTK